MVPKGAPTISNQSLKFRVRERASNCPAGKSFAFYVGSKLATIIQVYMAQDSHKEPLGMHCSSVLHAWFARSVKALLSRIPSRNVPFHFAPILKSAVVLCCGHLSFRIGSIM